MNIAIVSPFEYTSPPPKGVIRAPQWLNVYLADQLTARGHHITLVAPKGSYTNAHMEHFDMPPFAQQGIYSKILEEKNFYYKFSTVQLYNAAAYSKLYQNAEQYDLIHAVFTPELLSFADNVKIPTLCTIHKIPSDIENFFIELYKTKKHIYYNALSKKHRTLFPKSKGASAVIYNGIELKDYPFGKGSDSLIYVGRMLPLKGPDVAARVAKKTKKALNLYGEIPYDHKPYWEKEVKPHLGSDIRYRGLLAPRAVAKHYRNAKALLFPIQWNEAFGLVMVEAMASGTPVIACNYGSVPEIVEDGVTGYIVKNEKEMIAAVKKLYAMDSDDYQAMRKACRNHVEKNFSLERMVDGYEQLYYSIINKRK